MPIIQGSIVAIVSPMQDDGALDWSALKRLVDWHIAQGTDGIVVVGTTGESPTVNVEEHKDLIKQTVAYANGRIPVVAGTGGNSTAEAIALMNDAKEAGAKACLSVVPYYNRPTQEGMYQHFKKQAEAVDLPLILYNVPGRTSADLSNETVVRLAGVPGIVGIKDATDDIERGTALMRSVRLAGHRDFAFLSGCDGTALAYTLMGGHGTISVTANVAPRLMHNMITAGLAGRLQEALQINQQLIPLHQALFLEPNPVPVKWALQRMGHIGAGLRLPLSPLAGGYHPALSEAMKIAGVLS